MNLRLFSIALALILGVVGIIISWPRPAPEPPPRRVAVAVQDIPSYTVITPDMVKEEVRPAAEAKNAPAYSDVVGRMTTRSIRSGAMMSEQNALPVEQVRYVADPSLEVISFPARFDETVGGQLKPGQRVNVYGYRSARAGTNRPEVRLVAANIPVVDVRASAGQPAARLEPTPMRQQNNAGGLFGAPAEQTERSDPGSVVTVAVPPEQALLIVDTLGAQDFNAWVTLAGDRAAQPEPPPTATALPTATPAPVYTPAPTPNIAATIQAGVQATIVANQPASPPAGQNSVPPAGPARGPAGSGQNLPTTGGQKP